MHKAYRLIEKEEIQELNGTGYHMEHEKSGARLCIISTEDDNKVFSVNFKTPPADHTGLPHILEHSVLCGSRKFPLKDPFIELAKGSLNTFINAMTFSDKTMYPVASCNAKDFRHLSDVYLDAVFYPNIHSNDKILKQEGWHYELESPEGPITYNGVVYNEMKGAFSSPEQIVFRKIQQALYPDTPYAYESGGDPSAIPDLSAETFLAFHKQYYHPSNSYIFLYGDMDVQEQLAWLDEAYLSAFDRIDPVQEIPEQTPFDAVQEMAAYYPITASEDEKNKAYFCYSAAAGSLRNVTETIAMEILEYLLMEAPGAPLKEALAAAGIGEDFFGAYDNGILQPSFSIVAKNADEGSREKFLAVIKETLAGLIEDGFPRKKAEAAVNYFEFKSREADFGRYPKGVIYAIRAMEGWLHGESPFMTLKFIEAFKTIREGTGQGYFESLIDKYLLNNTHAALIQLLPDKGLLEKKEKAVAEKLAAYKASLSPEQVAALVEETKALKAYQEEPNSREAIATLPRLKLEDLEKEGKQTPFKKTFEHNITLLLMPQFTNGIVYTKLLVDTSHIPEKLLPYLGLYEKIIGRVDTEHYSYSDLSDAVNLSTGGIRGGVSVYNANGSSGKFKSRFEWTVKCFEDKVDEAYGLLREIQARSRFDNAKRLTDLILETKSRMQMSLTGSGHTAAINRAESYAVASAAFREYMSGIRLFDQLKLWTKDLPAHLPMIIRNLNEIHRLMLNQDRISIAVSAREELCDLAAHKLKDMVAVMPEDEVGEAPQDVALAAGNEGFKTAGEVQYVAKVGNFLDAGYAYSGSMRVLSSILNHNHLWTQVRIKGGAYGAFSGFRRNGTVFFASYRDPKTTETLSVFDGVADHVAGLDLEQDDIIASIIGAIGTMDQPLTPLGKLSRGVGMYLSNLTEEQIQKEREEVLGTTLKDLQRLSPAIRDALAGNRYCVIGNENKLEEAREIFQELRYLAD